MSHKDNMDLRNTGDGGWFYAEHELFSVFAPLIGPLGVSVYMAMCRLIPLAAVDPDRPVTERSVMEAACVSKGTAGRKMREIVALGMVLETRFASRRPSTYKLVSLRQLALVGIDELRRRVGAPVGGTDIEGMETDGGVEGLAATPQTASTRSDTSKAGQRDVLAGASASTASDKDGAPGWGTDGNYSKTTLIELLVPQIKALVPQKTPLVPQKRGSLFKEEKEEESPLSPPEGGTLSGVAAMSATEAEELRDTNAIRARMKPPLPPLTELHARPMNPPGFPLRPVKRRSIRARSPRHLSA